MSAHLDDIPAAELRALIRDVLRDVLPAAIAPGAGSPPATDGLEVPADGSRVPADGTWASADRRPAAPPSGLPAGEPTASSPTTLQQATGHRSAVAQEPRPTQPSVRPLAGNEAVHSRQVRLETDADLRQFALDILKLADNPARRRDLLTGRLAFTLARSGHEAATSGDHRIETGAVTERTVQSAAKAGQRLVLGPRAVLTPLARDRALALGVPIEKER